jgi:N-acetylglucosaminyl-diphospho-decaprenol L-rhamnosyltransferase
MLAPSTAAETSGASRPSGGGLTVVVVTYRSSASIAACLRALPAAAGSRPLEVIVVDNASDDGTADLVEASFPDVRVVHSLSNVGFSRANNTGLVAATGDYVCFLNPDTEATPGSLDRLCSVLEDQPQAALVAPRLLNTDGSEQQTARRFPRPAAAVFGRRSPVSAWWPSNPWTRRYLAADLRRPGAFPVEWVSGACMVLRRTEALASGGFDPGFFLYWEDADWCRRLHQLGRQVLCDQEAVVVHHEGAQRGVSARQVSWFHRSAYRYYAKHELQGWRWSLRPLAATVLAGRALAVMAQGRARRAARSDEASAPC